MYTEAMLTSPFCNESYYIKHMAIDYKYEKFGSQWYMISIMNSDDSM